MQAAEEGFRSCVEERIGCPGVAQPSLTCSAL
jgi:hypothetical protein